MSTGAAGSQDLDRIYRTMRGELRAFIGRRVRDPAAAEDLLHDVFLRAHAAHPSVRDPARLEAWIYRITRNVIVDWYRARRPDEPLSPELERDLPLPPRESSRLRDLGATIHACIDRLPAPYREALVAADLEGVSQVELARRFGLSNSGLKSRVQRARRMLLEMFLACCHLEFDTRGGLTDFRPGASCPSCREASEGGDQPR